MKDLNVRPFTINTLELSGPWYNFTSSEEMVQADLSVEQVNSFIHGLKKRFKTAYEDRKSDSAKSRMSYASRIASQGTWSDKAANAALLAKENIFAYVDELQTYLDVFQRSKSSMCNFSGGFVDLTVLLAPPEKPLKPLTQIIAFWRLQKKFPAEEDAWLCAIVEGAVCDFIQNGITALLTAAAQAKLPQLSMTAINVMGSLADINGYAQTVTTFLMQEMGSSNNQIAQSASKQLRGIKNIQVQAHSIVLSLQKLQDGLYKLQKLDDEVLKSRTRENGSLRGKNHKLRVRKAEVRKQLQDEAKAEANKRNQLYRSMHQTLAYLGSFAFLGGLDSARLYADLAGILLRLLSYFLKLPRGLDGGNEEKSNENDNLPQNGGKQHQKLAVTKENGENAETHFKIKQNVCQKVNKYEIGHFGIVRQILRVLGRIFDRAKLQEAPGLRGGLQALLELSLVSQFSVSVLILDLIFKYVQNSYKFGSGKLTIELINQFIFYLYKLTIRYDAMTLNKNNNVLDFYRLIVKVFKSYAGGMCYNQELMCAIAKRLIQTQAQAINPEVLLNALLTLQIGAQCNAEECKRKTQKGLNFKNTFPFVSPYQTMPNVQRTQLGNGKRYFDVETENPMNSNSNSDQFWENQLLQVHYHPSARFFAKTYQNNNLADFIDIVQQQEQLIQQGKISASKTDKNKYIKQPFDPNNVFQIIQGDTRFLTDTSGTKVNQIHLQQIQDIMNEQKVQIQDSDAQNNIQDDDIDRIIVQDLMKRNIIQSNSNFTEVQMLQRENANKYNDDPVYQSIMKQLQEGARDFTADQMAAMDGIQQGRETIQNYYEPEMAEEEYYEDELEEEMYESDLEDDVPQQLVQQKAKQQKLPKFMTADDFQKYQQEQINTKIQDNTQQDDNNPLLKAMRRRVMH